MDVPDLTSVIELAGGVVLGLAIAFGLFRRFLFICRPNEVLVVSGKGHQQAGGGKSNFTVIQAGTHWRIPFFQTVYRMDTRLIPIELQVTRVLSTGGIPLDVHAIANVKITTDPRYVYNAVERFLGVDDSIIHRTAKQTLEGALREVVSQLTPEQVNEDRIEFANKLLESTSDVFNKLGLHLDTLKIQRVEDEAKYLVNLGRAQIANAVRDAENAESQAEQEVAQEEAAARQRAELASKQAEIGITQKRNQLRTLVGQLEGKALSVERETAVVAQQARSQAEQELQALRKELETKRLIAEVVLPAEAQRRAAELIAEGDAALRRQQGEAQAEVVRLMSEAIAAAGPQARELFVLSQLDTLVALAAAKVKNVKVGEVHVVDGGGGDSLAALSAGYPAMVASLLGSLRQVMGIDIQQMLSAPAGAEPPEPRAGDERPALPGGAL